MFQVYRVVSGRDAGRLVVWGVHQGFEDSRPLVLVRAFEEWHEADAWARQQAPRYGWRY